ncbi:tRNA-splicing endonuclease positive effector-like [Oryza sativa Japonica Group]|uniref:tRNA-splicing endonuclease positive effector-like n=1 Tax=Oryza sativa subsp. japonica TaxID=39947 RepID=Q5JLE9_ORYSJ|nr:tRNA-splicing endonuclease positive effector-like [Oryza sativa Japonica Group]
MKDARAQCLQKLKHLSDHFELPNIFDKQASPFDLLVVDEAAQLKECESLIPLQLPGVRHAVLIGDEVVSAAGECGKKLGRRRRGKKLSLASCPLRPPLPL